ncbi:hypothetical protein MMC15_006484 [Xylographa vitiligo]|nr:hypothetical protein [Xylographa vitiligo]
MSSSSSSSSGQGQVPERPVLSQFISLEGTQLHENASVGINADEIDHVSQRATELETASTDIADSSSDEGHTDPSHPFRDESFPPPDAGSVASHAQAYAEAFLENQTVEFHALLTDPDTPGSRFERRARSLALDLLQHHARRLNLPYPGESVFFQAAADRVPVHARGNAPYAHGSRSLIPPHRRYQAALFRHDAIGSSDTNADHRISFSDDTTSGESSHDETSGADRPRRPRPPPPEDLQHAVVTYVTMYLAGQDAVDDWIASGDTTRMPYFSRLDHPGTPEYDASSDARVWALDVLELMAWEGRVHLPQPAAFFADYDELMHHARRWQFQFPYTQATVDGEERPTPIRSREPHPELGPRQRMTLSIETVETFVSNDHEAEPLLNGHGPDDQPLPTEYGPNPNPGHFGPQRMLDLYNNFIENPDEYWNSDERILTFDEPPAPPPYGPHQQDELHPTNESPVRTAHPDFINALNHSNCHQPPHGIPPSYRTSGPSHPHRHALPPPTTESRLNLLGEPITPRDSPPHHPSPPGPGPFDPTQYWDGDFAAALHATFRGTPPEPGSPSARTFGFPTHNPPNSPITPQLTIRNGVPSPEESPPSRASSIAPSTNSPASPPSTPATPLLPASHVPLPPSPSPLSLPPSQLPLSDSPSLVPLPPSLPSSPVLLPPSLPSSPVLLPAPIPPRNPNRSGLFGMVPRFPLLPPTDEEEEPLPASPPPEYASRESSPPGLARGRVREREEREGEERWMRWPEVEEGRRREWVSERFVRAEGEREAGGGRLRRRREGREERGERGRGGVWVSWKVEAVEGQEGEWDGDGDGDGEQEAGG